MDTVRTKIEGEMFLRLKPYVVSGISISQFHTQRDAMCFKIRLMSELQSDISINRNGVLFRRNSPDANDVRIESLSIGG